LLPRVLRDVSRLDTRLSLLGTEMPFPILVAPTAYHRLADPEGEVATARGAGATGATLVVSSLSTTAIEEVAGAATGPLWFQLYVQTDRGFTRALVERVTAAGCKAICVTVDTPVWGARHRETRARFALPPGLDRPNLRPLGEQAAKADHLPKDGGIFHTLLDPTLTWREIEWLLSFARVPVLLKGILAPADADLAARAGVAGIIVSNHGARNLDTVPATVDALPGVIEAAAGRLPVLLDGGIRRGTDVLKALALGADAVLLGRAVLWGLAAGGSDGVAAILRLLARELEMSMALCGCRNLAEIDRATLMA
jgi:4-hydroxymandelate oxidase